MQKQIISLYVNGSPHQVEIGPKTTLLEVLRDELHLTGTKNGCGQGHCGTCTVIVDGKAVGPVDPNYRAVRSCIYKASRADGAHVETIEGLAEDDKLHPLQRAFIEHGAVQCGFCTPGMIMAAKALLDVNPHPSEDEIKKALKRNLCRCTGYTRIIQAIRGAVEGTPPQLPATGIPLAAVGHPVPRPDARAKVTGQATFAADLYFEGMLHAKVLRSKVPHARLLRVDTSRAKALPGVAAVLTAEDVPGAKNHGLVIPDWPVLAYDKVRYVGDAIALVAAETEEIAEKALELIQVDYEPLPVVISPQEALAPDAPLVHDGGNLLKHIQVRKGDAERGFAEADVFVEREYRTPSLDHAFLEPEAGVATIDEEGHVLSPQSLGPVLVVQDKCLRTKGLSKGKITVHVGSQIPFADRRQIAASLAIPEEKVRVKATQVGGAFGGKEDISVQIHVALLAQATGRPVKLVFTRQESMIVHPKRHATTIRLRTGATKDGQLTAVQAEIYGDAGAYASLSEHVMTRTATHAAGPYDVPNVKIDCYAAYTNNVPAGAFRGFGVPQSAFAVESQMDILAEKLGLSTFELRRKNALRVGSTTATGQVLRESVGLLETINRVEEAISNTQYPISNIQSGWGIACAYKNVGLGGGASDCAGAEVELTDDEGQLGWHAIVRAGAAEVGQGLVGVLALVAAEELGLPYDQVEVLVADTDQTLDGGATTASRQSFITGNATRLAAQRVREVLAQAASEELDAPPDSLAFKDGRIHAGERSISLAEAVALAKEEGREVRASVVYEAPKTVPLGEVGDMHFAFGYATQAALVEVDTNTGHVKVLRVIAAHDVGRALNPLAVAGQIEGGVVMGLGIALQEEFVTEDGVPKSTSLARYKIPSIERTPEIVPIIVEDKASEGPYGAKGIGEIPSIPTAPAIINAIYNATGIRIYSLPATPKKVLDALEEASSEGDAV